MNTIAVACNGLLECAVARDVALSMKKDDKYNPLVFAVTVVTGLSMYIKHCRLDLIIEPPPRKNPSGTFMSSNHLVTHQAHRNGQYYDVKSFSIAKETQEWPKNFNF